MEGAGPAAAKKPFLRRGAGWEARVAAAREGRRYQPKGGPVMDYAAGDAPPLPQRSPAKARPKGAGAGPAAPAKRASRPGTGGGRGPPAKAAARPPVAQPQQPPKQRAQPSPTKPAQLRAAAASPAQPARLAGVGPWPGSGAAAAGPPARAWGVDDLDEVGGAAKPLRLLAAGQARVLLRPPPPAVPDRLLPTAAPAQDLDLQEFCALESEVLREVSNRAAAGAAAGAHSASPAKPSSQRPAAPSWAQQRGSQGGPEEPEEEEEDVFQSDDEGGVRSVFRPPQPPLPPPGAPARPVVSFAQPSLPRPAAGMVVEEAEEEGELRSQVGGRPWRSARDACWGP